MNQEIEKIKKEQVALSQEIQLLEEEKNKKFTRFVEIQGVIRYLKDKENEAEEVKVKEGK